MSRHRRHPDPLPFDPLSARNLAVACALIGLVTILLSERPTPGGMLLAWGGLAGWALLRLLGGRAAQPARRGLRPRPQRPVEVIEVPEWEAKEWAPRRPAPTLALPKPIAVDPPEAAPNWTTSAHPAVLAGVRRRREED